MRKRGKTKNSEEKKLKPTKMQEDTETQKQTKEQFIISG